MRRLLVLLSLTTQAFGAFSYYRALSIDHSKCGSSDLSNFPVLVSISHATLKTVANGGHIQHTTTQTAPAVTMPADLIFSADSSGNTKYPWEVESYDETNGILIAWVSIPTVSHTADSAFYMLYGDGAIGTPQNTGSNSAANVWDGNYKGVWHLPNGTTLSANDSTSGANHGTLLNTPTAVTGKVDGAANVASASNQYLTVGNTPSNPTSITFEAWIKGTTFSKAYNAVVSKVADGVHYCQLLIKSTGKLALYVYGGGNSSYDGTGAFTLLAGSWYHVVLTYDAAGGLKGYVNGSLDASVGGAGNLATNNATTSIGNDLFSAGRSFNGAIDEVRVSTVARPADWIVTEYNNQSAPGNVGADNFLKFGTETVSAATGTIRHRVVGGE